MLADVSNFSGASVTTPYSHLSYMFEDYNMEKYGSFRSEVENVLNSNHSFATFKSRSNRMIFGTFFGQWLNNPTRARLAMSCLSKYSPHLLRHLEPLAKIDRSVGAPESSEFFHKFGTILASPVILKYLFEISMLEHTFGDLDGLDVVEIGGGYGMMAIALMTVHVIKRYSIVDLEVVGELCRRHSIAAIGARPMRLLRTTNLRVVQSDLLICFFSISEQTTLTVRRYIYLYMRHAKKGYLQLNYDEVLSECGRPSSSYEGDSDTLNIMELFRDVWQVQPTAMLLPPPPCHVYKHHRIVWGMKAVPEFDEDDHAR